jgi:hypothetical protein
MTAKQRFDPDPECPGCLRWLLEGLPRYRRPSYQKVQNTWMRDSLRAGRVIDVRQVGVEVEPGVFRLTKFIPDVTYVDPKTERFLLSIGRDRNSGEVLGAFDQRFYQNPDYECLYLH